jgi:hypothetical protein
MDRNCNNNSEISPARRGQIVQRVLVDGWTPAQTGLAFGIAELQVVRWVGAYRRYGMASLRGDAVAEYSPVNWMRGLRTLMARWMGALRLGMGTDLGACVDLHQHRDDRRQQ